MSSSRWAVSQPAALQQAGLSRIIFPQGTPVEGTNVNAEVASGTGVAENPQITIATNITEAAGTGVVTNAQASIAVNAIEATATGVVDNASVTTGGGPSRVFDGANDRIVVGAGSANTSSAGARTWAAIIKRNAAVFHAIMAFTSGSDNMCGLYVMDSASGNDLAHQRGGGGIEMGGTAILTGEWYFVAITKASGTSTPRGHVYRYSTTTWTHNDAGGTQPDDSNATAIIFGEAQNGSDDYDGKIALAGVWTSVLSDSNIETLEGSLSSWLALSPQALWPFRQDSTSIDVQDIVGSADQTSITGTTVDAADGPTPFDWSISVNATEATGTGVAQTPQIAIAVNAVEATATGTANDATASTGGATNVNAQTATATGDAQIVAAIKISPVPTTAAGITDGYADPYPPEYEYIFNPSASIAVNTAEGASTGVAQTPNASVAVNAVEATGTGVAENASVQTTGATNVNAQTATATGTAETPNISIAVNAVEATSTGNAQNVQSITITSSPAEATGIGTANDVQASIAVSAVEATGTGIANDVQASIVVNAAEATATGVANDATVSTATQTNAQAETATGTGVSNDTQINIAPVVEAATAAGTAETTQASVGPSATEATGTGVAQTVGAINIAPSIIEATGTGVANDASVTTGADVNAQAETATATGTANDVQASIAPTAEVAAATGVAETPQISIAPVVGEATASGTALNSQSAVAPTADTATATGVAETPQIAIAVNAATATGTGDAQNATALTGTLANAQEATSTGTSHDPQITVRTNIEIATGVGTSEQPQAAPQSIEPQAQGTAHNVAAINVASGIQPAVANGDALDPVISIGGTTNVNAQTATGTGDGLAAAPSVAATAQDILNVGTITDPQIAIRVAAELASAVGAAFGAEFSTGQLVPTHLTTYVMSNILTTIVEAEDTADVLSNELRILVG